MSEKRVYMLTAKGNAELTGASTPLAPEEHKLLVLVEGYGARGAQARRGAARRGAARGADGYVTKPFDMDVVLKAVKSVLGFK
jgi:CheY-like chemotaxis protein